MTCDLLAELDACVDWVLVEGFRESDLPKVEVWRACTGHPARYPIDAAIVAVATDDATALPVLPALPVLDLNAPVALANWLVDNGGCFDDLP